MKLILPSVEFKDSFIEAVREFSADTANDNRSTRYMELRPEELEVDFAEYVEKETSHSIGENLPEGYVPETSYWLIEDTEFIGRVSIRHNLTEHLERVGGHIGYDIRPSKRNQGYGSKILELALPKAKELGIDPVLVTCDESNIGSRKIIEKNSGVLESVIEGKLRFWIAVP